MNPPYSFAGQEDDLEQSLTAELRPAMPSSGFTDAVMLRVGEKQARNPIAKLYVLSRRRPQSWLTLAALLLLLLLPATFAVRREHRLRQAELTQARFDLAMRLTSRTLSHVDATIDGTLNRAAALPKNFSSN